MRPSDPDHEVGSPSPGRHRVREVMVRAPNTHPSAMLLTEAREALAHPKVHMLLLVEGARLIGTVVRSDLEAAASLRPAPTAARDVAVLRGRTVAPDADLAAVHAAMVASGERRRAVVDADGRLLGLLCLKRGLHGFCSDDGILERRRERRTASVRR